MRSLRRAFIAFQNTILYPILFAVFVVAVNTLGLDLIGFYAGIAVLVLTVLFNPDTKKILPLFIMGIMMISENNSPYRGGTYYGDNLVWCILGGVIIAVALIYAYAKAEKRPLKELSFFWGFVALVVGFVFGGSLYMDYSFLSLAIAMIFAGTSLVFYVFFASTMEWDLKSFNWFCNLLTIVALAMIAQLGILYYTNGEFIKTLDKGLIYFGWSMSNTIASSIALVLPFIMYQMSVKKHSWIYFIVVHLAMLAIVYTFSRTSLLASGIIYIAVAIYNIFWGKNRKVLRILYLAILVAIVAVVVLYRQQIINSLQHFIDSGMDDSGRFNLYIKAWKLFIENPLFGIGLRYVDPSWSLNFVFLRFHNHYVQLLASTGVFGFACYVIHRAQTLKVAFTKPNLKKVAVLLSLFVFFVTSALDVTMFNPLSYFFYIPILIALDREDKLDKVCKDGELDVSVITLSDDGDLSDGIITQEETSVIN